MKMILYLFFEGCGEVILCVGGYLLYFVKW